MWWQRFVWRTRMSHAQGWWHVQSFLQQAYRVIPGHRNHVFDPASVFLCQRELYSKQKRPKGQETGQIPNCSCFLPVSMSWNDPVQTPTQIGFAASILIVEGGFVISRKGVFSECQNLLDLLLDLCPGLLHFLSIQVGEGKLESWSPWQD